MIEYGLKLWSSNPLAIFQAAVKLCQEKQVDFVELYHNPALPLKWKVPALLKEFPVTIHNTHSHGWHQFELGEAQLAMWQTTLELADFFQSPVIVVHPGHGPTFKDFCRNLKKIDDPRILIENMAGIDLYGQGMFAATPETLRLIKAKKNICFDFEKAVKAASYLNEDYQDYIKQSLIELRPVYFHISGGDKNNPVDEHTNLWDATFDVGWIADTLKHYARDSTVRLVFETPKVGSDLHNDLKNIVYFKKQFSV